LSAGQITVTRRVVAKGGGKSGGSQSQDKPIIDPNTLRSIGTVRILEVLSEGPIVGPHDAEFSPLQSVYLDETPVVDANGTQQFVIQESYFRYGLPEQEPIPGYPVSEATTSVGVELHYNVPVVRACTTPPLSAIRYVVRVPALFQQTDKGDMLNSNVGYNFEIQINGGAWVSMIIEEISGKTTSPYERAVRVQLPVQNPDSLQIRMTRIDPDPSDDKIQNKLFWSAWVEIIDGRLAYDDTAVVAMTVDAETFPQVPQRAYLLDGLLLDIPSNYDGRARTYDGDWDGTFQQAWTNNPAWALYGLLTNERWGLGRYIDTSMIDKWSFYDCARSNDELVTDGANGTQPRWTCNCVVNTRQDAYTVLQAVASSMLGLLYWSNGTVFLVQDRLLPGATRLFGPSDVEGGIFDYAGTDYRSRWTAAAITWNDPSNMYKPAVELVQDPALVALQGYRETAQTAFGCTSRGQAIRFGRWLIYTSQYETEVVSFKIGLENADLRPGDLIAVSDPSRAGARLAGRLLSDDGIDTVTLDKVDDAMLQQPVGWTLYVTVGSAAQAEAPKVIALAVQSISTTGQLVVAGKVIALPPGSMWLASQEAVNPRHFRVASIHETTGGGGKYEVMATEYHEEKFTYVDTGVLIPPPSFSLVPTGPLLAPSDVSHKEYIYLDGSGVPQFGIILSWLASPDPRVVRYQLELAGVGDIRRYANIAAVAQDVPSMRQGDWTATLTGFDNIGRRTLPVIYRFTPTGLSARPAAPLALYLTPQGRTLTLVWVPSGEIDVLSYWIKWTPVIFGSVAWGRATTSIAQVNRTTTQITTPTRPGTYMVKAVDALGQESDGWAQATLGDQISEQVKVIDVAEQPDWLGDLGEHWQIASPELRLPPPTAPEPVPPDIFPGDRALVLNATPTRLDIYSFASPLDLGVVCEASMVGITDGLGGLGDNSMSTWTPLASAKPLAADESDQWDAHVEVRVSQDAATFDDWRPLKSALITGRVFEWRIVGTIYDLATTLRLVRGEVQVEIPLRTLSGDDVPLDGTGHLTVTYAVPFLSKPTVQLTARDDLAPGGNIVITASAVDHFTVEHRDETGAATAGGRIDYLVQGYGGHS
jgi:predicted phage tail protein